MKKQHLLFLILVNFINLINSISVTDQLITELTNDLLLTTTTSPSGLSTTTINPLFDGLSSGQMSELLFTLRVPIVY